MKNEEIDRLIVEKVMGWVREQGAPYRGERAMWCTPITDESRCGLGQKFVDSWQPSTNIAHAFEVRDKIKEMRFSVRMKFKKALQRIISERAFKDDSFEDWAGDGVKKFVLLDMGEIIIWMEPIDICLAALEAVKGKE